jgi:predicted transcriptional regulator
VVTDLHDVRVEIVFARCHPEQRRGTAIGHLFGCPSTLLGVTVGVFRKETRLAGFAGVSHEKFAKFAVTEHHDDAVLVDVVTRVGEKWKLRREDVERHAVAGCPPHSASRENDRYAMPMRRRHRVAICAPAICLSRIENHPDRHCFEDRRCTADMIAVGVSCAGRTRRNGFDTGGAAGYTKGMKTAVSIPDDIYLRAEELAEQTNRTRSRLYSDALGEYLARHGIDAVTTGMNEALAGIDEGSDAFLASANRSVLAKSEY